MTPLLLILRTESILFAAIKQITQSHEIPREVLLAFSLVSQIIKRENCIYEPNLCELCECV